MQVRSNVELQRGWPLLQLQDLNLLVLLLNFLGLKWRRLEIFVAYLSIFYNRIYVRFRK